MLGEFDTLIIDRNNISQNRKAATLEKEVSVAGLADAGKLSKCGTACPIGMPLASRDCTLEPRIINIVPGGSLPQAVIEPFSFLMLR